VKSVIHVNTGSRIMVIPGARRLMIVTMKLSAAAIEGHAEELESHDPHVDRMGGLNWRSVKRRVAEPAASGRPVLNEPAEVQDDRADGERPEGEGIDLGNATSRAPDLQRHDEIEEPGAERHDDQGRSSSSRAS